MTMRLFGMLVMVCLAHLANANRAEAKRLVAPKLVAPKSVTLVAVGDVGLNRNSLQVDAKGILEGTSVLPWAELTAGIASLIDGDFNFMNLETVVTDRNDLRPGNKRQKAPYLFRSHPIGVAHLLDLGFNLISAANNHAYAYGEAGARETVAHLRRLSASRPGTVATGINYDEAAKPASAGVGGMSLAFSSIGIVTNMLTFHRAGPDKAGTLGFRYAEDWKRSVDELVAADADLKVLSVHYGTEKDIRTDERQRSAWRAAVDQGVDMVIGHHAHVVRGIELHKGKPIFYGLGNFLIRGAANMGKKREFRTCCDYGLLAKMHFARVDEEYELAAIEVVPVFDMHRVARRLEPAEAAKRVEVLNVLAESLDDPANDSKGVRFQVRNDGSGLYCGPNANRGDTLELCAQHTGPTRVSAEVRQRVRAAPDPKRSAKVSKAKGRRGKAALGDRKKRIHTRRARRQL